MNATCVWATNKFRISWFSIAMLILLFGLMAFFQGSASAAVFSVNNVGDAVDVLPGDGFCMTAAGLCTLRAAIMEANALPGPDVIVLSTGIYNLSIIGTGEDNAATGDLDITDSLTILGTGMSFTVVDGLALDRVFHIAPTPADFDVSIEGLTIRGGNASPGGGIHNAARLTLENVSVSENFQGGIYNEGPALALIDSEVRLNSNGAGIKSFSPSSPLLQVTLTSTVIEDNQSSGVECINTDLSVQGGILSGNGFSGVWGNGCEMTFSNVEILNNSTSGDGGGIMSANYAPVVNGGVIRGNQAAGMGGGVYYWGLVGREMQMTGVLLEDNQSLTGGGIHVDAATATLDGVTLRDNRALESGGGIYLADNNDATLNLLNGTQIGQAGHGNVSDADGDSSGVGAGIYNIGALNIENSAVSYNVGDGIWNEGPAMMLSDSIVSYNDGQGIYTFSSSSPLLPVAITNTDIVGNDLFGYYGINGDLVFTGGSVRDNQGIGVLVMTNLTMSGATVSGNASSSHGGGLYLANIVSATVTDTTISGNAAVENGGGIYYWGFTGGELSLTNVTISGNEAGGKGGGIIVDSPPASVLNLTNVTLSDNRADADMNGSGEGDVFFTNGTLNLVNTILNGNGSGLNCAGSLGDIFSQGYNLSSDASCPLGAVGDQTNTDPMLSALQNNGGPTLTHALLPGSPAIDAGDDLSCPPTDQRGEPRPQGAACDVGAYESPALDVCAVQTEIPESECRALEDFYISTDGHSWTDNTDWLVTVNPCSWYGVTCDAGHVTELMLPGNGITGVLPASLVDLPELMLLRLNVNQLTGDIPSSYGSFPELRELMLWNNQLSGDIPPELGNLSNATFLSLGRNNLSGTIPPQLGNLTNLRRLELDFNQLSGPIPIELTNLTNLDLLGLSNNQLSGTIPAEFENLVNLTLLSLSHNQLSGTIPPELGNMMALGHLAVDNNDLSGSIPIELGNLSNLIGLSLGSNQLSGVIPVELGDLVNLRYLWLNDNQLLGNVPDSFGNLVDLRELYLHGNVSLTGPLPLSLINLSEMEVFHYYDTDLCNPPDAAFQAWLSGIQDVLGTNVTCAVDVCAAQTEIPESECRALEDFYASTNGDGWTDSTDWLVTVNPCSWYGVTCDAGHVIRLMLPGNGLTGVLPASLVDLSELRSLHLNVNQLTGSIPSSYGSFPELRVLMLWNNQLSGDIPPELGNLSNATLLSLGRNNLSGTIPPQLGNLTNLGRIELDFNQLSGPIPIELTNLTNLDLLGLSNNQLSGTIPAEFENLVNLTLLSLSHNQLSGTIPPELGNMNALGSLGVDNNDLSGSIPIELGNLSNLIGLSLGSNQLSGVIPVELGDLVKLQYLRLNDNQLLGNVPNSFGNLVDLQELYLYGNVSLTGPLPLSLINLFDMEVFYYYDTDVCAPPDAAFQAWLGAIPDAWGNGLICGVDMCAAQTEIPESECRALEDFYTITDGHGWTDSTDWMVTDTPCSWHGVMCSSGHVSALQLVENNLSGPLPESLVGLSELITLDLSHNQLTGNVPPEFGTMSSLELLGLSYNQLSGNIPPELGDLKNLTNLELASNDLIGPIPSELGNLSNLTWLYLFENRLSGEIPWQLGNLSNLLVMNLYSNEFTGPLPDELGNLVLLRSLQLHDNPGLTGMLPLTLADLLFMETFYFEDTDLCEPPHPWFQTWLNGTYDVRSTDVTCDIPFCSMVTEIPQQECEALEALYTSTDGDNWYYSDGWMERIEPCTWSGVYCPVDHVTRLDLQANGLNGNLPPELGQLGYLEFLNLHDNQLSGPIPPEIGSLGWLQTLYLSENQLTGSIPASFGDLSNLQRLALRNNQLSGSLPPSIGQLSNLEYLSLGENPFSGTLPPEWGNLGQLTYLSIYRNPISGTIPPEWGNLSNLEDLRIISTQIGGVIPAEFGNLSALEFLTLADNQLTGPLPPELGDLPNLLMLQLQYNQLTGALPAAWGNLPNILVIDVYSNPLSGPVPMSFINLSTLNYLGFQNTNICEPPEPVFQDWLNNLPSVSSTGVTCPNTDTGTDVTVIPIDYASGTSPVTMTFANVLWEGYTSLEITDIGPEPPDGFMLGDPPTYFEIDTTAGYYGVEICIDYSGISYVDETALALNHYEESTDKWVDVTTSHDMVNDIICGYVEFLSPFAVFEEMNKPPSADANGPYAADEGEALSFDATGSSDPDGDELAYTWDFGDGEAGSGSTPAHAYGDDGEFVVTLVVNDPDGLSDSVRTTATIQNVPPSIEAGDDVSLLSGEALSIAADFTDPGTLDTHTATIDFGTGDGPEYAAVIQGAGVGTVSGSHQYFLPGSYDVEVCVRDDDGGESCDAFVLHVAAVTVEIDVWPHRRGHWPACRSPRSIIPVVILSSDTFDATLVDPLTVRFGPDGAQVIQWKRSGRVFAIQRDVNRDGLVDLELYFRYGDTGLTCASRSASLHGQTTEGVHFLGEDSIRCRFWWRHIYWSNRWRK